MGTFARYKGQLPHIGGIILPDDAQLLKSLFSHLEGQAAMRKKRMSESGAANIKQYNAKSPEKLHAIFVFIHNFEAFSEEQEAFKDKARELMREGDKAGIFFVLTGSSRAALPSNIQRHIKSFICLQMPEPFDYKNVLNIRGDLKPEPVSGRGLVKMRGLAMEFQTAIAVRVDEGGQPDDSALMAWYSAKRPAWKGAAHVLTGIPDPYVLGPSLAGDAYRNILQGGGLPLGYNMDTNALLALPVEGIDVFPIVGGHKTGKTNMLKCLMALCGEIENEGLFIFDSQKNGPLRRAYEGLKQARYADDEGSAEGLGRKLREIGLSRSDVWKGDPDAAFRPVIVFIDDIVRFYEMADKATIEVIGGLMAKGVKYGFRFFVACEKRDNLKGNTTIHDTLFAYGSGMLLGGNFNAYPYFKAAMSFKDMSWQCQAGTGFFFSRGKHCVIQTPQYEHRSGR
jgi:hypothetical protein